MQIISDLHALRQQAFSASLHPVTVPLMTTFVRQPDQSRAVLGIMRDLAERGHGYVAQGVAGWARATEMNQLLDVYYSAERYTGGASEELRLGCANRGYYQRLDVRVEGATTPVWIYRITDEAAQMLNKLDDREHVPIAPGDPRSAAVFWMPATAPAAMDAMRTAAENPGKHVHVAGEPEWRTSLELTNLLKAQAQAAADAREAAGESVMDGEREPAFMPGDMRWLVDANLAEELRLTPKTVVYRLTRTGREVRPLVWHGPTPGFTRRPG